MHNLDPRTPSTLLAALILSPSLSPTFPQILPTLCISPPSPPPISPPTPYPPIITHRPLTPPEAHQITLLLTQYLFPVRSSPKGLMRESISLAEKLHQSGIRWDGKRRVMGLHLRGIWEEGGKLGVKGVAGFGPMDLYIQGSFLSIAELPHPLDLMPIPIDVHPSTFAALPKLTLQAGLANALPGAGGSSFLQAVHPNPPPDIPMTAVTFNTPLSAKINKKTWEGRRKAGLKIRVDGGKYKSGLKIIQAPHSAGVVSARGWGNTKWPKIRLNVGIGRNKLRARFKAGGIVLASVWTDPSAWGRGLQKNQVDRPDGPMVC